MGGRRLRSAAVRALERGSADSATHYLTRALEEPPTLEARPDVLVELGEAEGLIGEPQATERLGGRSSSSTTPAGAAGSSSVARALEPGGTLVLLDVRQTLLHSSSSVRPFPKRI